MDLKIQKIGTLDTAKLFFDPLRKDDSFIVLKEGNFKTGFILDDQQIILESDFDINWSNVTGIIGGFTSFDKFTKIKDKINEQVK